MAFEKRPIFDHSEPDSILYWSKSLKNLSLKEFLTIHQIRILKYAFFFPRDGFKKRLLCNEEIIRTHWHFIIFQNLLWLIREQKCLTDKEISSLFCKQSLKCCSHLCWAYCQDFTLRLQFLNFLWFQTFKSRSSNQHLPYNKIIIKPVIFHVALASWVEIAPCITPGHFYGTVSWKRTPGLFQWRRKKTGWERKEK